MMQTTRKKLLDTLGHSLAGMVLLGVATIAINLLLTNLSWQLDLSEGRIRSLSPATCTLVTRLPKPATLRFYYSENAVQVPGPVREHARRIRQLLRQYEILGHGDLRVEIIDPDSCPEAARSAALDGVSARPYDNQPQVWCGLAASSLRNTISLPFLSPDEADKLEYDISRVLRRVTMERPKTIAILSALPVGGMEMPADLANGKRPTRIPAWSIVRELYRDHQVVSVPDDLALLSPRDSQTRDHRFQPGIDLVVVIHPKQAPLPLLYALDQYVMQGGKVLVFLDPFCTVEALRNPAAGQVAVRPPGASTLEPLLTTWGVGFDTSRVLADLRYKTLVPGRDEQPVPTLISVPPEGMDSAFAPMQGLSRLQFILGGAFDLPAAVPGLSHRILCHSSPESALVESYLAREITQNLSNAIGAGQKPHPLIVELKGSFPSAWRQAPLKYDTLPKHRTLSTGAPRVILVADVDMLYDSFTAETLEKSGQQLVVPVNDNLRLTQNLVDDLLGEPLLTSLRSRTRISRPLTHLQELAAKAEQKYRPQIASLTQAIHQRQKSVDDLQVAAQTGDFLDYPENRRQLAEAEAKLAGLQRDLEHCNQQLYSSITTLQFRIKLLNLALVPALVALIGAGLAFWRWQRRRPS